MHRAPIRAVTPRRVAAALLCALAAVTLTAAPVEAATGTLTGVVRDESTGAPLAEVLVEVVRIVGKPGGNQSTVTVGHESTDADGRYTIENIQTGTQYRAEFSRNGYVREWAHDQTSPFDAAPVSVPGVLDARISRAATVSGAIVDETGAAVTSGQVGVSPLDDGAFVTAGSAELDEDGRYSVGALLPGRYTFTLSVEGWPTQYFHRTFDYDAATPISLAVGENTVDEQLLPLPTGIVRGTVTDLVTGAPVKDVCLSVNGPVGPVGENNSCTGVDGTYEITGVATQTASVEVSDEADRYVTNDGFPVAAVDGQTVTRDIVLEPAAKFTAVLTDAVSGAPVPPDAVCLEAEPVNREKFGRGACAQRAGGKVTLSGLRAGRYLMRVDSSDRDSDRYGIGWVTADNQVTADRALAKVFGIGSGATKAVGKVKVGAGGSVGGVVTDAATGKPLADVCVGVERFGARSGDFSLRGECTNATGRYTVHGLAPGGWVLQISSQQPRAWFYSGGAATRGEATPIPVTAGRTASYDISVSAGAGTLAGTIKAPGAASYDLDVVSATEERDYVAFGSGGALTDGKARFELPGIAPQQVKIRYWVAGVEHWHGGRSFATAKVITIVPGTTTVHLAVR